MADVHRRVVVTRFGGPDALEFVEEPIPRPGPGEVRIRSRALGLSGYDAMMRRGARFPGFPKPPFTPGVDVVGLVDALGDGVAGPEVGARVAALLGTGSGAQAEYVCVPAEMAIPVPHGVDPVEAACIPSDHLTATTMMRRAARVEPGERILVHGAAGGVGSAIVMLGALDGLEMYGTASAPKHDFVRSLGAIPIDYRNEDFVVRIRDLTGDGVDVVFDPVGGSRQLRRSYSVLRKGGRLVWFGVIGMLRGGGRVIVGSLVQRFLLSLRPDGRHAPMPPDGSEPIEWYRETMTELLDLVATGKLQPPVAARIPFDEMRRAHELLDRGVHTGKLVLVVDGNQR